MIDQVSRLMDAYRPNPNALVQNKGIPPDLIKLIALQQLKAEKEAAERNVQLMAAPQGEMPTVDEQLESDVLDLTTRDVARQVGGTAQQAQQSEKQNLQRLLKSGIAAAPGAQSAAQPRFMAAAGGIVAFNGETGSDVQAYPVPHRGLLPYAPAGRAMRRSRERAAEREEERLQAEREAAPEAAFGLGAKPPAERPPEEDLGANVPPTRETKPVSAKPDGQPARPAAPPPPPPPPPRADGGAPAPTPAPTSQAAPPAAPDDVFGRSVRAGILGALSRDPMDTYRDIEARYPQQTPEERAAAQDRLARRRRLMEETYDPKRQGIEQLLRMGARFSQGLTPGMAAGPAAEVGLNYAAQQRAARQAAEEGLLGEEEKMAAGDLAGRRAAAAAGLKGLELERAQRTAGISAGAHVLSAEMQAEASRVATLAKQTENDLSRRAIDERSAMDRFSMLSNQRAQIIEKARAAHDKAAPMNVQLARNKPDEPKNRQLLAAYDAQLEDRLKRDLAETDTALAALRAKLKLPAMPTASAAAAPSTEGFTIKSVK